MINPFYRTYLACSAISPKFSDDMQGCSRTKKIVYFRVNFKLSLFETSESAYKFRGLYVLLNGLLLKDNYKNMFLSSAKLL